MTSNLRKYLVLGIALIMVASAIAMILPNYYNAQQTTTLAGPAQQNFEKSMSTGNPVQMTSENLSAVQQQLAKYGSTLMPATQSINFLVNLKIQDQSGLAAYISQENNALSPYYHQYLTANAFKPGAQFGPSLTAYQDMVQYYTSQGFNVVKNYNLGVEFQGTVGQVNSAFNTSMMYYSVNGAQKFANNMPLSVPSVFANSISSIDGLSNMMQYQPLSMVSPGATAAGYSSNGIASSAATTYLSQHAVLNYSRHSFAWANVPGYGLTQFMFPTTMPELYNATGLINKGYNGKGITIAVVMGQGYNPSDLQTYANEVYNNPNQILNRISNYPVNGAAPIGSTYWNYSAGLAGEFTLDIQYSSTMAPGAHIDAVYGPDLSTLSLDMDYLQIATMIHTPQIVTNSWGGDEAIWFNLYGSSYQNAFTMNYLFEILNSMGSTVLFSSGDSAGVGFLTGFLTPAFGSTSPYVVGVGGVRTVANSTQGPFPTGNVSNFTLAPYSYQAANGGFWYPNFPLNVANATGINTQSYWYTPNGATPFAGGQVGISYWYNQSAYQHGPGIPNVGRQNSVDISAEADFNETEFFSGMWNFFWGGTSFACPTTAGQMADIMSYANATLGATHFGNMNPLIYQLGNFQNTFALKPFYSVSNGSNPWAAANQNLGWPNDMTYPANWTQEYNGYTFLTGWGTINTYNFAVDLVSMLSTYSLALRDNTTGMMVSSLNGITLNSGIDYNFTAYNFTAQTVAGGATVNITVYNSSGAAVSTSSTTTAPNGWYYFNTTGFGNDTAIITVWNGGATSYWYVFINETLTTGNLVVTLLQNNVMGGFSVFNNLTSPNYPGYAPLMPNTVAVLVTLNGNPVANAYVYAIQNNYHPFYYNSNEFSTPMRSVGFTNASGIAFVETWNVAQNVTYNVIASYEGLSNNTTLNVLPQYFVLPGMNTPYYYEIGVATKMTGIMEIPSPTPGTSYNLSLMIRNWNLSFSEGPVNVSVGWAMSYPGYSLYDMTPVITTAANGTFTMTINDEFTPGLYYFNITTFGQSMMTYNGIPMETPSTYIPLLVTGSVGGEFMPTDGAISSPYAGQGWDMYGAVMTNYMIPLFGNPMNITGSMTSGPMYSFDGAAPQTYAVGTYLNQDGQNLLVMDIAIPTGLPMGLNSFTVTFTDSLYRLDYTYTTYFWIISSSFGTSPASTIGVNNANSPNDMQGGVMYYTGNVQFLLTNSEPAYTTSTLQIMNAAATVNTTFDVTGLTSFNYNFAQLGAGTYTATYTVMNPNGEVSQASMSINTQSAYTVTFSESGLASGTSWNVTFNGLTASSTSGTISISNVLPGSYSYSIGSVSGFGATPSSGTVSVSGNGYVNVVFTKNAPTTFTVLFKETGLNSGSAWNVTFDGKQYNSTTTTISITGVASGSHTYKFGNVTGYTSPGSGTLSVTGNVNLVGAFSKIPSTTSSGISGTTAILYAVGGVVGGLIVGGVVTYAITRKPKA